MSQSEHPSMFVWCDDCQLPRLRSIAACPVCRSRRIAVCMLCADLKTAGVCRHCDGACKTGDTHPDDCPACKTVFEAMAICKAEFAGLPDPTDAELHDLGGGPIGSVGRCQGCGGRTYVTSTGPWCPRAFCDDQTQASD